MKCVTLNNGVKMPILGYGVYQTPPDETERCVREALEVGSRLDRLHTPLNRANRAFNTRDTPPKAAKPSAFFLKFIIAGARPHINTKFENKLDTAIPFSHGIISLFHSERGC